MTQHITVERVDRWGKVVVTPELSAVWRDDQTILWILAPGLMWPKVPPPHPGPIYFDDINWPGSQPTPVGPLPANGIDTRHYVAECGKILPDDQYELYSYKITAQQIGNEGPVIWTDPDVENRPLP
jgi:hypothetical protein